MRGCIVQEDNLHGADIIRESLYSTIHSLDIRASRSSIAKHQIEI